MNEAFASLHVRLGREAPSALASGLERTRKLRRARSKSRARLPILPRSQRDRPREVTLEDHLAMRQELGGHEVTEVFVRRAERLTERRLEVRAVALGDRRERREEGRGVDVERRDPRAAQIAMTESALRDQAVPS